MPEVDEVFQKYKKTQMPWPKDPSSKNWPHGAMWISAETQECRRTCTEQGWAAWAL